ncbi:hypothetical protein, partial [Vibrio anguillarum]|uniref:hypothetical protein n=2 Tax=Vibrio anguillarum TaxID=55601 RepID=UPI001BE4C1AC
MGKVKRRHAQIKIDDLMSALTKPSRGGRIEPSSVLATSLSSCNTRSKTSNIVYLDSSAWWRRTLTLC